MITWLVLVVLTAGINLFALLAIRGRWGPVVPFLAAAALVGVIGGNAGGALAGLDLVRIGDFYFVAASMGAQAAMLATLLLAAMVPPAAPPGPPADEP
jgi:hypothetical protein